jgi:hypothetical protein
MANEIVKPIVSPASLSFEPDILGPHQYLKNCQRSNPAEPEKALMFAVLAEAVDTYQRFAFSDSPRGRLLFREAKAWLWGEKPDSVFAFRSICEVFGLDPSFLRRGLMKWTADRQWNTLPRKKIRFHLERGRARKSLKSLNGFGKNVSHDLGKLNGLAALPPISGCNRTSHWSRRTDVCAQKIRS